MVNAKKIIKDLIKISYLPINKLKPAEYNPRKISEVELENLRNSIKLFGLVDPIVCNKDLTIIGGHQRVKAAKLEGLTEMPCVVLDLNKEKEKMLNLRLNKSSGEWDAKALAEALSDMSEQAREGAGFNKQEVAKALNRFLNPDEDNFIAEPVANPKSKLGDIYLLGQHRIMCGSSTSEKDMAKLMDGTKIDLVITDPPYNVDYSGRGKKTSTKIKNDNMSDLKFRELLESAFKIVFKFMAEKAGAYVCYSSSQHIAFEESLIKSGFKVRCQIIWVKMLASMGWGDYRWKHEPILYLGKNDVKPIFYGTRSEYTTWEQEPSDKELLEAIRKQIAEEESGNSTVWRLSRDSQYEHPTQKPVKLYAYALMNSSKLGDDILDPFAGGGYVTYCLPTDRENRLLYGIRPSLGGCVY